jgi:apolipoprotein N-acyltransferase
MTKSVTTSRYVPAALAAVVSGGLYFFSTGLEGFRPLVWIAPLPVLLISLRLNRSAIFVMAFTAYVLGGLNLVPYLARLVPPAVLAGQMFIPPLAFAIVCIAFRDAMVQFRHMLSFLAFPIGWTAYEYLLSIVSPHGSAGSIAYSQSAFLSIVQIASLTGVTGITFVLTLVPAGVTAAMYYREGRLRFAAIVITVVVGAGTLGYGWSRLSSPLPTQKIRAGAAAIDSCAGYFDTTERGKALGVVNAYARLVSQMADSGAEIVVLPEKLAGITEEYSADAFGMMRAAAARHRIFIVAGFNNLGTTPHRNMAFLFSSDGNVAGEYDKAFHIPGIESDYKRGEELLLFDANGITGGVAICKDLDFSRWIRQYGQAGVEVLYVPAWDFKADAWLHSRMAVVRGIENGFSLVRAANEGMLTITDDRGRVLAERTSDGAGITIVADVARGAGRTFYTAGGDWFPASILLVLLALLLISARRIFGKRFTDANSISQKGIL